jgi:hypothetical protein
MPEMPPDLRELYFIFGVTAEKVQVMETAAGNAALAWVMLFVDTGNITPEMTEWFKQFLDDVNSKTFGTLLRTIKKSIKIGEYILAVIDVALEKRNYVTHHFFRYHNFAIHSEEGRQTMIDELKDIGQKFDTAQLHLDGLASCLHQLAGRSIDFGKEEGQRFEARGKRVNIS